MVSARTDPGSQYHKHLALEKMHTHDCKPVTKQIGQDKTFPKITLKEDTCTMNISANKTGRNSKQQNGYQLGTSSTSNFVAQFIKAAEATLYGTWPVHVHVDALPINSFVSSLCTSLHSENENTSMLLTSGQ